MNKERKELEEEISVYERAVADNISDLEKAHLILNEIINSYDWDYEPNALKAIEYGKAVGANEKCDDVAKNSWQYIHDYRKIMQLICIAMDYCCYALERSTKAYSQNESD